MRIPGNKRGISSSTLLLAFLGLFRNRMFPSVCKIGIRFGGFDIVSDIEIDTISRRLLRNDCERNFDSLLDKVSGLQTRFRSIL